MNLDPNQTTVPLSPPDLENMIRRVVREELFRFFRGAMRPASSGSEHEGPDDPTEGEQLLEEALAVLKQYGDTPEAWMDWEDFEAELDRAEPIRRMRGFLKGIDTTVDREADRV
jgi:hypothetical protein